MSEKNVIFFYRLPNGGAPKIPKAPRNSNRDDSDAGAIGDLKKAESVEEQPQRIIIDRLRDDNE